MSSAIFVSTIRKVALYMKEIIVKYLLQDDDLERLKKITEKYKELGLNLSVERQFESIMCLGSKYDIDEKFKFHEWKLGLRESIS